MGRVNIAVIDSGIDERVYNLGQPLHRIKISSELEICNETLGHQYHDGHGTTIAAIIKKYYPNAILSDIKVLSEEGKGNTQQFLRAIEWCIENDIRLINLSLGTIDYTKFEEIRKKINYAYEKGIIIVAACNNKMIRTYPASLSNVIGVKCVRDGTLKEGQYLFNHYPLDGIEITACGSHKLKVFDGTEKEVLPANSYATPFITAEVGKLMEKYPSITLEDIKIQLEKSAQNANEQSFYTFASRDINWVEKALVFNLELAKYPLKHENCFFEIIHTINIKSVSHIEVYNSITKYINDNKDVLSKIDTIIINADGVAFGEIGYSQNKFIKELSLFNKNIVFINSHNEDIFCEELKDIRQKIWIPQLVKKYYNYNENKIEVPIIVVYDFIGNELLDILTKLKKQFEINGYNPITASNIASSIVAGAEFVETGKNEKSFNTINSIYTINNPDLIILGINAVDVGNEYISALEKELQIDVRILVSNILGFDISSEFANTIYLTDNHNDNHDKSEKSITLYYNQEDYSIKLYEYIIELFENDSE